jgi:putative serine protease PepD
MSDQQPVQGPEHGDQRADDPPRLAPRPLNRPPVETGAAEVFGRPSGVSGSFDPVPVGVGARNGSGANGSGENGAGNGSAAGRAPGETNGARRLDTGPPPHHALVTAFSRPAEAGTDLQRPPGRQAPDEAPDPFWEGGAARDPWRDPGASVRLGPPGVSEPPPVSLIRPEGARLSVRELLFGRRVKPVALALLGVTALLIGAVGGLVGKWASDASNSLTEPGATISTTEPSKERPAGSVADIAARVVPAVVSIQIRIGDQGGTGSGVVLDADGHILTNNHVVSPAAGVPGATIKAIFHDNTQVPAQIVGRDPKSDLAVIKVNVPNPTVARIGSSAGLAVGDGVIAIGSPLGLVGTVTTGIVSALHRPERLDGEGSDTSAVIDAIQTDAAINPGNSGGPLVDSTGAVIGLNAAITTFGQGESGSIGLGFAIPIDYARTIAQQLIRSGSVKHPDLGANVKSVTDDTADGAQVQNVRPGSAAAAAGIVERDVIVKLGNRKVGSANELQVAVQEHQIGEQVPIQLIRQGRPLVVTATLKSD